MLTTSLIPSEWWVETRQSWRWGLWVDWGHRPRSLPYSCVCRGRVGDITLPAIRYYSRYSLSIYGVLTIHFVRTQRSEMIIILTHVLKKSQYPVKLRQGKPTCLLAPMPPGREIARPEISSAAISSVEVQLPPGRRQQTWHACPAALHSQSGSPRATQYVPVQNCWNGENSENEKLVGRCVYMYD